MKIACISDIHNAYDAIEWPEADVLVVAGDVLPNFTSQKVTDAGQQLYFMTQDRFHSFLRKTKEHYKHVIMIPGNHDHVFQQFPKDCQPIFDAFDIHLLIDQELTIDSVKFYGSPWTPWFHGLWWSFNFSNCDYQYKKQATACWSQIPKDTDVLITHGPPYAILDETLEGKLVGCRYLGHRVRAIQPKLHVFGHIHESHGVEEQHGTTFVNASYNTRNMMSYYPVRVVNVEV